MFRKFFHAILIRRHFWRYATFSEVAELYTSRMLRMVAMHISSTFMSIYLYQEGMSILMIALFWAAFYVFKCIVALPSAALAAWIGPKRGILVSNILYIPAMIGFALLPEVGMWLIWVVLVFQGLSAALYTVSYSISFSKVKSTEHAGKEIAYMNIIEKVATGLSPLLGGVIALLLGPQSVLVVAAILFLLAALPLFKTSEPVALRQKLLFRGFPGHLLRHNVASEMALGFDVFASGTAWSLYVAVFIIGVSAGENDIYVINGILVSVVLFAALASSYAYGKLIDGRRGGDLLRIAAVAKAITYVIRPAIGSPVAVAGLNIANEAATTGYAMAYTRGIYDNADLSGRRATYIGIIELLANFGAACAALGVALLVWLLNDARALEYFFLIAAAVVLLVASARFPLYRK